MSQFVISNSATLTNIADFIEQRPGFDWRNYGDGPAYRADVRAATRQLHDARALLGFIVRNDLQCHVDASGRFAVDQHGAIDYTTGQYWCTEFRAGACRYLSAIVWRAWREWGMDADRIEREARIVFGRGIARRWFSF